MTADQLVVLHCVGEAAVAGERETGCPAEISAAQCIVESAWLMIAPENHCFGTVGTQTLPGFHSFSVRGRTSGGASQAASALASESN